MSGLNEVIENWKRGTYYIGVFCESLPRIRACHDLLADDESRRVLLELLQAYATTSGDSLAHLASACSAPCTLHHFVDPDGHHVMGTEDPYFLEGVFPPTGDVVLLDGGAYVGDTIELASRILGTRLCHYYAFEPNEETFGVLQETLARVSVPGSCFRAGLSDHSGSASFLPDGAGSRVSAGGTETIELVDAGTFVANPPGPAPTFVKLDVEGQERAVLSSLLPYLRDMRPDLAVSAYHELSDLWEIPLLVSEACPDYRVYLRHQSNYYTETVCYATARD